MSQPKEKGPNSNLKLTKSPQQTATTYSGWAEILEQHGGKPLIPWWIGLLDKKRTAATSSLLGQPLSTKTTDLWQCITETVFGFFYEVQGCYSQKNPHDRPPKSMTACQSLLISMIYVRLQVLL
jgi:hypothetical protein